MNFWKVLFGIPLLCILFVIFFFDTVISAVSFGRVDITKDEGLLKFLLWCEKFYGLR